MTYAFWSMWPLRFTRKTLCFSDREGWASQACVPDVWGSSFPKVEKPSLFFCQSVEDFQSHGVRVYGDQRFWWICQSLPDQVFHLFLWLSLISVSKAFKSTLTFLMYTGIVWWHVNFNLQSKYICLINLPFQLCFKDSANGVIGHKSTLPGFKMYVNNSEILKVDVHSCRHFQEQHSLSSRYKSCIKWDFQKKAFGTDL